MKDGYILIVIGTFLADGKNNVAAVAENVFRNNDGDIRNWLEAGDVIVVDRGFQDAAGIMAKCSFRVEIPNFLKGSKQLPAKEENHNYSLCN